MYQYMKMMIVFSLLVVLALTLSGCSDDGTTGPEEVDYSGLDGRVTTAVYDFPALTNILGDPTERPVKIYKTANFDPSTDPVLYLLHGFGGSHETMTRFYEVHYVADYLRAQGMIGDMAIVMPNAANAFGGSFYTNSSTVNPLTGDPLPLGNYQDYILRVDNGQIAEDCLVWKVENDALGTGTLPRERRMIAGLSMGGYGAMKLALTYPEYFTSVSSHSGVLYFEDMKNILSTLLAENPRGLLLTGRVINTAPDPNPAETIIVDTDSILTSGVDPQLAGGAALQPGRWAAAPGFTSGLTPLIDRPGADPANALEFLPDYPNSPRDWGMAWEPGVWLLKLEESLARNGMALDQFRAPESEDLSFSTTPAWTWATSDSLETAMVTIERQFNIFATDATVANFAYFVTRNHYTDYYIVYFNDVPIDTVGANQDPVDGVVTPNANNIGLHYAVVDTGGVTVYYDYINGAGVRVSGSKHIAKEVFPEGEVFRSGSDGANVIRFHALSRFGQPTPLERTIKTVSAFVFAMGAAFQPEAGYPQYQLAEGFGISLPFNTRGMIYETAWHDRWLPHDPYTMLDSANLDAIRAMRIHFDVGASDQYRLNIHANWFDSRLNALNIDHDYHVFSGGHSDRFYNQIAPMLKFHNGISGS